MCVCARVRACVRACVCVCVGQTEAFSAAAALSLEALQAVFEDKGLRAPHSLVRPASVFPS